MVPSSQLYDAFDAYLAREITTTVRHVPSNLRSFFPSVTMCPKAEGDPAGGFDNDNMTDVYLNAPKGVGFLKDMLHRYGQRFVGYN